jgi:hypothetical protein
MRCNRWASVMMIGSVAGTLAGCGEDHIGSGALKTSGMYANFKATANGDKTTVDAQLRAEDEDGDIVILEAGDTLIASVDDETHTLKPDSNKEHYLNTFDATEDGTLVTIDFERRDSGDKDAPDSHVRLPEPFDMSLEVSGPVQRNEDVVLTWEPSGGGDRMYWLVRGDCVWDDDGSTADDGRFTLTSDHIDVLTSHEDEPCTVTVTLERHSHGAIDSAFRNGRFLGIQGRSRTFSSVPVVEEPDDTGTGGSGTTETGGSGNEAGAPSAGSAGSPAATGGTGTGGSSAAHAGAAGATHEEAGAAGAAMGGSSAGGATQAAAGSAGAAAGSAAAAAGSAGASGQGGAAGQG